MNTSENPTLSPDEERPVAKSEGRRRLLKLGTVVAPVVLTLSSRSVLACHCKSPSAGGSLTFASHRPRNDPHWDDPAGFDINGVKTFSGWKDYWQAHQGQLPGGVTKNTQLQQIPGLESAFAGDTTKIKDLQPGFKRDIVTAWLNLQYNPVARNNCLTLVQLQQMATGSYSDPVNNVVWGRSQIRHYLRANWLLG